MINSSSSKLVSIEATSQVINSPQTRVTGKLAAGVRATYPYPARLHNTIKKAACFKPNALISTKAGDSISVFMPNPSGHQSIRLARSR